jgi:hypothetical protein
MYLLCEKAALTPAGLNVKVHVLTLPMPKSGTCSAAWAAKCTKKIYVIIRYKGGSNIKY